MTKKFFCLVLVIAMLGSFFMIGANAATIAESKLHDEQDFTLPEGEDGKVWRPEGWIINGRHGNADLLDQGIYNITDEGYVELCRGGYDVGACVYYVLPSLPKDFTLMFDVCFPATSGFTGELTVLCSLNGYKQQVNSGGAITYFNEDTGREATVGAGSHENGKWYTYVYQISGDRMSVYRKSEDESVFSLKANNLKMATRSGNEFYAYSTSPTGYIYVDNVKIFTGTYMTGSDITINEEKTMITGTMDVTSGKATPVTSESVMAVMTAYDSKGKVLDMAFETVDLKFNDDNSFTVNLPITSELYEKLVGGKVELYLWDSFAGLSPQTSAYTAIIQ